MKSGFIKACCHALGLVISLSFVFVEFASPSLADDSSRLQAFTTDACSLFPNRSLSGEQDWCECCVKHDLAYWRGGTEAERLQADQELYRCVKAKTANEQLAQLMYTGVRSAGGPQHFTSYRWGYGWPYGRPYQALSAAEREQVQQLSAQISETQLQQVCRKPGSK